MKTANKHDPGAFKSSAKTVYRAPGGGPSCAANHIIYITHSKPQDNNNRAWDLLTKPYPDGLGATSATRIRYNTTDDIDNDDEANWGDEFAKYFSEELDLSPTLEGRQGITVHRSRSSSEDR